MLEALAAFNTENDGQLYKLGYTPERIRKWVSTLLFQNSNWGRRKISWIELVKNGPVK